MRVSRIRVIPGLLTAAALAAAASAQEGSGGGGNLSPEKLEPIDQRVGDLGPLGTSLRDVQNGLYQPGDFGTVYQVPGLDGTLMRVQGGLFAVFDQSRYLPTPRGAITVIPPNTIFYIGAPPAGTGEPGAASPLPASEALIDQRVSRILPGDRLMVSSILNGRVDEPAAGPEPRGARRTNLPPQPPGRRPASDLVETRVFPPSSRRPEPPAAPMASTAHAGSTLFNDSEYRAGRLRALLRAAAERRMGRSGEATAADGDRDFRRRGDDRRRRP